MHLVLQEICKQLINHESQNKMTAKKLWNVSKCYRKYRAQCDWTESRCCERCDDANIRLSIFFLSFFKIRYNQALYNSVKWGKKGDIDLTM